MFDRSDLEGALSHLERWATVEPGGVAGAEVTDIYGLVARAERLIAASRLAWAAQVERSHAFTLDGDRTAAQWIARTTGVTLGQAIGTLEVAERLERCETTAGALARGDLSETQARHIVDAARVAPDAEADLVAAAAAMPLPHLKQRCAQAKATAAGSADAEASADQRIRARRCARRWTDPDGAGRIDLLLPADDCARAWTAVEARANQLFDEARTAGRHERPGAYLADAMIDLLTSTTPSTAAGPRADVSVIIDITALQRGFATPGETCLIPGVGPVSVATARSLLNDSVLRYIITDGTDVRTITSPTRTIPAKLRAAVEARDPTCVIPGCPITHGLEIDHWQTSYADGGQTSLDNLARLCRWHHYQRTHCGAVLTGGPGHWQWQPPPIDPAELLDPFP